MIEVQSPPGTVVGYVKQEPLGILNPWFSIQNAEGETVLRMKGPQLGCSCYSDANFFVSDILVKCVVPLLGSVELHRHSLLHAVWSACYVLCLLSGTLFRWHPGGGENQQAMGWACQRILH